jgi:RNA recognition motif-containing protein
LPKCLIEEKEILEMKIIILNLARSTTKEKLKVLFEEYGSVESCDLVLDKSTGRSKGFGFVEMPKPEEAESAIKNLNNKRVASNKIRVKKAEEKKR